MNGLLWKTAALSVALIGGFGWSGCESSSSLSGDEMFIEVQSLSTNNTSVALLVVGGESPYTWWVEDNTLGSLSGVTPDQPTHTTMVNYQASASAEPGNVNTVWVRDNQQWTASARLVVE